MWATTLWDHGAAPLQWGVAMGAALVGALCDVVARRVPNVLTVPVLATGLGWAAWIGGASGLLDSAVACIMLSAPFVLLFALASGGAGDAKLMGALGAWLGLVNGAAALGCVAVAGVGMAVGVALAGKRLRRVLTNVALFAKWPLIRLAVGKSATKDFTAAMPGADMMQKMPYGPAIFAGVCLAAIGVNLWRSWG